MKKNPKFMKCPLILFALFLMNCSHTPSSDQTELDKKIKAEPPATTPEEIARRGAYTFISTPGLTQDQRQKLMQVYTRTFFDAEDIRGEIGQSKSLIFKMLASPNYKKSELEALKTKIVELDQKRLRIMFQALEDVQKIVGTGEDKEPFYKHFQEHELPSR